MRFNPRLLKAAAWMTGGVIALSACGDDDTPDVEPRPSGSSNSQFVPMESASASPSPSPSASPSPTSIAIPPSPTPEPVKTVPRPAFSAEIPDASATPVPGDQLAEVLGIDQKLFNQVRQYGNAGATTFDWATVLGYLKYASELTPNMEANSPAGTVYGIAGLPDTLEGCDPLSVTDSLARVRGQLLDADYKLEDRGGWKKESGLLRATTLFPPDSHLDPKTDPVPQVLEYAERFREAAGQTKDGVAFISGGAPRGQTVDQQIALETCASGANALGLS